MNDYGKAKELKLTSLKRYEKGVAHHPMVRRLMLFLIEHDFYDYGDHFRWEIGDKKNDGVMLMYQMDAFFETLDKCAKKDTKEEAAVWEDIEKEM